MTEPAPGDAEEKRSGVPRSLSRTLRGVELFELTMGAVLLLAILVLVMMQVLARVTPMEGKVWSGELARFCLMWLAFSMAGYLMGREEHITLDAVDHILPAIGRFIVHSFSLLVVAATCIALTYEGWDLVSSGSPIKSPAAGIPLSWLYVLPTLGMALTAVRAILLLVVPGLRRPAVSGFEGSAVVADVEPTTGSSVGGTR